LYGLMRKNILDKIDLKTYIEADGLLLIELARYGEFYMIPKYLMKSHVEYSENNQISLTHRKKELIEYYEMWPKFFLMKYEKATLFIFFSIQILKWSEFSFVEKIKTFKFLHICFFGLNKIKVISIIKTILFYLKFKNILINIHINESIDKIDFNKINTEFKNYDTLIISHNSDIKTYKSLQLREDNFTDRKIKFINLNWTNEQAKKQYSLDFIKKRYSNYSHCLIIDYNALEVYNNTEKNILLTKIKKLKYFNKCIKLNEKIAILLPIRDFVNFITENDFKNNLTIKTIEFE